MKKSCIDTTVTKTVVKFIHPIWEPVEGIGRRHLEAPMPGEYFDPLMNFLKAKFTEYNGAIAYFLISAYNDRDGDMQTVAGQIEDIESWEEFVGYMEFLIARQKVENPEQYGN